MEKKSYITPELEIIEMTPSTMVAASISVGNGEADAGQSFTKEQRGSWGNIWN